MNNYQQGQHGYPQQQPFTGFNNSGYIPPAQPGFPYPQQGYSQSPSGYLQATPGFPQSTPGYPQSIPGVPQYIPGFTPSCPQSTLGFSSQQMPQPGYQQQVGGYIQPNQNYGQNPYQIPSKPKHNPTVVPANPFNPRDDAAVLRKAMKGIGTDEKAIIQVLTRRTNNQRLKIAVEFKTLFGKDLIENLKKETSGRFEDLLVALMTPFPQFCAKELHNAIAGLGTDEDVLIEIMCTTSNSEVQDIKKAYSSSFGRTLDDDIKGDTSGNFKKLMTSLCMGRRSEDRVVNKAAALEDAKRLHKAGKLRIGTDESVFNEILCQRSLVQLAAIFEEYQLLAGHDIDDAIKSEFSGLSEKTLRALVRVVRNQSGYFAERLYKSMKGLGTNDRQLIRIMVTRCEVDLMDIKEMFQVKYGKSLQSFIEGDCSGDYKKCLLGLLGS